MKSRLADRSFWELVHLCGVEESSSALVCTLPVSEPSRNIRMFFDNNHKIKMTLNISSFEHRKARGEVVLHLGSPSGKIRKAYSCDNKHKIKMILNISRFEHRKARGEVVLYLGSPPGKIRKVNRCGNKHKIKMILNISRFEHRKARGEVVLHLGSPPGKIKLTVAYPFLHVTALLP